MMNKSNISRVFSFSVALAGFFLVGGHAVQTNAQSRDPFIKPGYAKPRVPGTGVAGKAGGVKAPTAPAVPSIEQRIDYYKRMRENAAASGMPIPKVTSVLTLDEMAVTGIFKTPRGYAAMVEAVPIKLSYTIYPGEKFFDGQLVAVEENKLVFRKVAKVAKGKFVASVENKALRQYTTKSQIEGTAPVQASEQNAQPAESSKTAVAQNKDVKVAPAVIISPLDEMNSEPAKKEETKSGKAKKPVKVAKNK